MDFLYFFFIYYYFFSADVTCPSLPHPANGVVLLTNLTEGSLATYSCNEGFGLAGDRGRMCQSDGMWSGEAATCVGRCHNSIRYGSKCDPR
jgi:hypothetical protein